MLTEDIVDLDTKREQKKSRETTQTVDYVNNQLEHFVAALIDDLQSKGVDRAEAEKVVGDRMSDLVLAFDLKDFDA